MRWLIVEADYTKFPELEKLRKELGAEGYGVWWSTLCLLAVKMEPLEINYEALAKVIYAPPRLIQMVVEDYGLFEIKDGKIWNPGLDEQDKDYPEEVKAKHWKGDE